MASFKMGSSKWRQDSRNGSCSRPLIAFRVQKWGRFGRKAREWPKVTGEALECSQSCNVLVSVKKTYVATRFSMYATQNPEPIMQVFFLHFFLQGSVLPWVNVRDPLVTTRYSKCNPWDLQVLKLVLGNGNQVCDLS